MCFFLFFINTKGQEKEVDQFFPPGLRRIGLHIFVNFGGSVKIEKPKIEKERDMNRARFGLLIGVCMFTVTTAFCAEVPVSEVTAECIDCHMSIHPGIVESWRKSRHAAVTPKQAMAVKGLKRKFTGTAVPAELQNVVVGCAECHTLRAQSHVDSFEHIDYNIHVVVSPDDCKLCHTLEARQYAKNIMAHAHSNLNENMLYQRLLRSTIGKTHQIEFKVVHDPADPATKAESCYYCHGTRLEVVGTEIRDTEVAGELEFPKISGWPNQGVGRINLDGSLGACTACHTRHSFSIEMARKPYTCKQCHVGPDSPAFKVYAASKHGNIYASMHKSWNFENVPWTIGKDFTAPTCATCHISLLVNTDEELIAERTHQMNNRLPWRLYGLIYAHAHPTSPDTTRIQNKDGLPLPTSFDGGSAAKYLIGNAEIEKRTQVMQTSCLSCHDTGWVKDFWKRLENTIQQSNAETLTATNIMRQIWKHRFARGLGDGENPFDEAVEKKWVLTWLFYGNSIRFASAMAGGGDYGVFAGGRFQLSQTIVELNDWLNLRQQVFPRAR